MGKRRESLITIPKRNATSEGPGGQLSAQCLMKNRRGKRGWSGRDMHVPPSAPMALLHVYEAAEPHHSTQPSHKLSHLLCLLRIEPSLPPSPCSSSMQEQNGRTLKAAGAASVPSPKARKSAQLGAATESHPRIAPSDRGRDLSRVPSVRPQALHRGPRPHPLEAQRVLRARGPQRAPAPVAPQPDSPTDILHPLLGYTPVIHSSDGVLRKSLSSSRFRRQCLTPITSPPQTQQLIPRGPREARQRGLFGDPLPPWP